VPILKSALLWAAAIATAAALLIATDYRSRDPDSSLYARLSGELARQPVSRWIAPEWNGAWNQQGLFREHPVGILLPSATLVRAGLPEGQAAYIANMFYQAAVLALIPMVAGILLPGAEARSLAWLLQLLPVSFVYRIRGNQEQPLLMCFLALLYGTHRARTNPAWIALMVGSFCTLVLIKGAFAMFALVSAALWLVLVPVSSDAKDRADTWAWAGLALAVMAAAGVMMGYEVLYVRTTGESFLEFYRSTRLGESMDLGDPRVVPHAMVNVGWYLLRLVWFAAPWSVLASGVIAVMARATVSRRAADTFEKSSQRGVWWVVLTTMVFIAVLSPANVRAERFIFPTYFMIATIGIAAAIRRYSGVSNLVATTDRFRWLPVSVWFGTFLLSLGSKLIR
jgi:hypothetical protein